MKAFVGIDPGVTGALAILPEEGPTQVFDMPILEKMKSKERSTIDVLGIQKLFALPQGYDLTVILEQLHPQTKIGAVANFSMGESAGTLKTFLALHYHRVIQVLPAKWKKGMGMSANKDLSRQKAMELFPELADQLKLKKHHGRAEALLLADYGRRLYGKQY
jgi:hypothetical protein